MKAQYNDAAQAIQKWITTQKLSPMAKLPSARLLAEQIGFSKELITRAYNILIAKKVLIRTGYKLTVSRATSTQVSQKGIVYILSYFDEFTKKAEQILSERGISHQSIKLNFVKHLSPISTLHNILAKNPAGVILRFANWHDGLETALELIKTPIFICSDGAPPKAKLNVCGKDYYRATEIAIQHLKDLGHSQIAMILHNSDQDSHNRTLVDNFRKICLGLDLKRSALNIWELKFKTQSKNQKTLLDYRKRNPEVTALFCTGSDFSDLVIQTFRVPEELSVINLFSSSNEHRRFLTTVEIPLSDYRNVLWACTEIISLIQTVEMGLPEKIPMQTFFMPSLMVRSSTRAITPKDQFPTKTPNKMETTPNINLWGSWQKSYSSLKKGNHQWHQLDLKQLANHSMTKEHGWLGRDPLLHFPPGLRQVHGVPFEVIHENRNHGNSVITFKSPYTHSTKNNKLPVSVQCPVKGCYSALYFLHGCGWGEADKPFAKYIIHFKTKKIVKIPLIPIGPFQNPPPKRSASLQPNIQDWWSDLKPQDFPHAMYATVFNPANPPEYQRTLYTLEWINPRPKEEISFIEIQVDPKAGPTLALIAITARL